MNTEERTKALKQIARLKRRLEVAEYVDDIEEIRNLETLIENIEYDLQDEKSISAEDISTEIPF